MGSKIILTEQNSYPGKTTKFLEKYADEIHISFEDSKKYFRNQKVLFFTGNPVRANIYPVAREAALKEFNLSLDRKTLFVSGGSLGARSINDSIALAFKEFDEKKIQIIWQTGNKYYETYKNYSSQNIIVLPFIVKIDKAYSACDLFLARAGATTIAEILTLGIASILVPSPNVTENHQYYNAKSLSDKGAAILLEDNKLKDELTKKVLDTIYDEEQLKQIRSNALFSKAKSCLGNC
jgi:UDP-N-acetylglucosamine--N-acetylmuramyl-(pentapeptide) pyrophosphoryl-undecaprenol N-acetylglucosamine transferase